MSVLLEELIGIHARVLAMRELVAKHLDALDSDVLGLIGEERQRLHERRTTTGPIVRPALMHRFAPNPGVDATVAVEQDEPPSRPA
jgi:hypothetical protein